MLIPFHHHTENQPVTLPHESEWVGWMVLLCMAFTDGDGAECLEKESFPKLANYQKVSYLFMGYTEPTNS